MPTSYYQYNVAEHKCLVFVNKQRNKNVNIVKKNKVFFPSGG